MEIDFLPELLQEILPHFIIGCVSHLLVDAQHLDLLLDSVHHQVVATCEVLAIRIRLELVIVDVVQPVTEVLVDVVLAVSKHAHGLRIIVLEDLVNTVS